MVVRLTEGLAVAVMAFFLGGCAQTWADLRAAPVWSWEKAAAQGENTRPVRTVAASQLSFRKQVKSWSELKWQQVVRQEMDFSCGSAALATVLRYYHGIPITEEEIIRQILDAGDIHKIQKEQGFSLLDLKKFSESRGFAVDGYRLDFESLVMLEKPAIVPVVWRGYRHFVVFRGLDGGRVYLADPAYGNVTVKADAFIAMWQKGPDGGVALVVTNSLNEPPVDHLLSLNGKKGGLYVDGHSVNRLAPNTGLSTLLRAEF